MIELIGKTLKEKNITIREKIFPTNLCLKA